MTPDNNMKLKSSNSLSKKDIAKSISTEIQDTFQDLVDLCLSCDDSLINLNFASVKNSLLKSATPKEMAQVSKLCGSLKALFSLAATLDVRLDNKIIQLAVWSTLPDFYLESNFPVLFKGKDDEDEE
jgi:hypothetical protein